MEERACTFFGHRDCPEEIKPGIRAAILEFVESCGVEMFYVGNQGRFDVLVRSVLRELGVNYAVVLAYLPTEEAEDTMLPEGIEGVHPRYAISWRNRWMVQQAQFVICYVRHTWGGAYSCMEYARRQGRTIINLAERE